jgi:hypothetical protein
VSEGIIVDSDYWVQIQAASIQNVLNALTLTFHAYHTQLNPTPSNLAADFLAVECTFDTYAPISMPNAWTAPTQIGPGHYAIVDGPFGWLTPTAVGDTIWGFFITDAFNQLVASYEFTTPVVYNPGDPAMLLNVQFDFWARSLLP